jgi:hypothetical protein
MRIDRKVHTKSVEDGITTHMWGIGLVFRKRLVHPSFSISWTDKPREHGNWAGPGFTRRNDESAK